MNVAVYCRASTDRQEDSPEVQLGIIRDFCKQQGHTIVAVYLDVDISRGSVIEKRPGFAQLLQERKVKHFDAVVILKIDRISGDMFDFLSFERVAKKHKLKLIYATESFEDNASGELMKRIKVLFSEFEIKQTGERVAQHNRHIAMMGQWPGGRPPLGLIYDKNTKSLLVDNERLQDINAVFRIYIDCNGNKSETAARLNLMGIKTATGGLWRDDGVGTIIRNPIYRGRIRLADIDVRSENVPQVIQPDLLSKVDLLIDNTTGKHVRAARSTYTYSNLLICSECGFSYKITQVREQGPRRPKYEQYICRGRKERGICSAKKLDSTWLDRVVPTALKEALTREMAFLEASDNSGEELAELETRRRRIANLRQVAKRKQEMYAVGIINNIDELKRDLAEIDNEIAKLSISEIKNTIFTQTDLRELVNNFNDYWDSCTTAERHTLLLTISPKIYVYTRSLPRKIALETRLACGRIDFEDN